MKKLLIRNIRFFLLIFTIHQLAFNVSAQVRPVYDYGAVGLGQILKKLNTTKSVMMIGAHPDDEDSALLAYLARGENARTAYLSLTRGDGGQNLLGDELFESLGVIRTEELLQARRLDGAEQFFTRAFDYGFSKTLTEAKEKWDEKIVLCDAVRAIREFRPLVVISRFSGTTADGHGQHQFAGYISPLAVKAAADSELCKDAGQAWQVQKFYVSQGFRSTGEPNLRVNTGQYDFLLGRSYFEIAMEGRSQHKTQEQGVLELKGDRFSGLNLIESKLPKVENENSIFDGIDTSLAGIWIPSSVSQEGDLINRLQDFDFEMSNKLRNVNLLDSHSVIPILLDGLNTTNRLFENFQGFKSNQHSRRLLEIKQKEFIQAIQLASGIQIDALSLQETIVPGEKFQSVVKIYYPKKSNYKIKNVKLKANGWEITKVEPPKEQTQSFFGRETPNEAAYFSITVPKSAKPSQPVWLENPRDGDLFVWTNNENQNLPFQKPLITAEVTAELDGVELNFSQPVEYRFADDIRGEIRRELNVVPTVSITLDRDLWIIPQSSRPQKRRLVMSLTNNSQSPVRGTVSLNSNSSRELNYSASSKTFELKAKGEKTAISFEVEIPPFAKPEEFEIYGQAMIGEALTNLEMQTISYPHIQTHRIYKRAMTAVKVLDLKVVPVNVGYIMGSGDKVPQAIGQMGLNVTMLDENYLSSGDLSRFDTIVVGIRAAQTRPDFVANNKRLINFMNNGGTLIVQYQQYEYARANLPPFPAKMESNIRTVDENASVRILAPGNPVFNFPNKITEKDFDNWVQERNLYTFTSFDEKYTPLLETHDAGEAESAGGMVYAEVGNGKYVYTAYSFFRQLPAGNPGAFRLFANLLSLPKSGK